MQVVHGTHVQVTGQLASDMSISVLGITNRSLDHLTSTSSFTGHKFLLLINFPDHSILLSQPNDKNLSFIQGFCASKWEVYSGTHKEKLCIFKIYTVVPRRKRETEKRQRLD